jgi:hypothetical protein
MKHDPRSRDASGNLVERVEYAQGASLDSTGWPCRATRRDTIGTALPIRLRVRRSRQLDRACRFSAGNRDHAALRNGATDVYLLPRLTSLRALRVSVAKVSVADVRRAGLDRQGRLGEDRRGLGDSTSSADPHATPTLAESTTQDQALIAQGRTKVRPSRLATA